MIEIKVTDKIRQLANNHTKERIKYEYDRFKLSLDKRKSMILIGSLGQIMFKHILDNQKINYEFQFQAGNYDLYDFKINNDIIEIKTSGYNNYFNNLNLLYANDQYIQGISKNYSYCVQQFLNGHDISSKLLDINKCSVCSCIGFIEYKEIKNYPNVRKYLGDDYKVPLSKLKPIELLLNKYVKL